nr:molecular chaperone HtpG [Lachnospiraceae bacterium]
ISEYITKKVAEKLSGLCKTDKENYEKYWEDISPFVKYGYLRNDKFAEKINDFILFKDINGEFLTLPEALKLPATAEEAEEAAGEAEKSGENSADNAPEDRKETEAAGGSGDVSSEDAEEKKEKKETIVYYVTDEKQQSRYIDMFKRSKMDAVILTHNIDTPFMQSLEGKNEGVKFMRIDANVTDSMTAKESKKETEEFGSIAETVQKFLRKAFKKEKLGVKIQKLKDKKVASVITVSEETRRMQDMMKMYSMGGSADSELFKDDDGQTLILNANHPLVKTVMEKPEDDRSKLISEQLYDLAVLANKQLPPDEMKKFIERSNEIMMKL